MKRMNVWKLAGFVLALVVFGTAAPAQEGPDSIEGNWTIYSTNIDNGLTVVKHVQIAQYGNQLSGFFEGPEQSGPIEGTINVHHVEFQTKTHNVLTFRGTVDGNTMSGLYGIRGKHAPWQAVLTTGQNG
jgi:hypothetical protein